MNKMATKLIAVIALTVLALTIGTTTYAAISVNKNLSSSGSVTVSANLGVYSDSSCTTPLTTINWGTPTPGASVVRTVYIKNTGTGVSLTLSMAPSNWTPSNANTYMTLTWSPTTSTLAPGASTAATLTLTVSSGITDITDFSVQINITGNQ
jgi:hypothetical protein